MGAEHEIKLLDCTLRDGGYLNDWKFGRENLISIYERLVDSGVDFIEIGFLDERRPFDADRSIMPDTMSVNRIYGALDRADAKVLGMIDFGTCGIEQLQPCRESCLDGIRVIFKKHLMHPAMEFCRQVKAKGYDVFAQLVSITSYTDDDLLELIELVNEVRPYAVSMVDTYGLMHPEEMIHYSKLLDQYVNEGILIGFHAHNNFQMAYANCVAFLDQPMRHDVVVDGTLYGMGKSAGNAPLELLAMRLNDKFDKSYRLNSMLEAIQESILNFRATYPWGYRTTFFLSARNRCHPNYVNFFREKGNLSISMINDILATIEPEDAKLLYDERVAADLYQNYISRERDDSADRIAFLEDIGERKLLLVGPGRNIKLQENAIKQFIEKEHPYRISINYIPKDIEIDCIFVTNSKRYHEMFPILFTGTCPAFKMLATSNVECARGQFDFVVNRAPLLETNEKIIDNSFLMLLKLLMGLGIQHVYCAGFDGYSDKDNNYFDSSMEYDFVKQEATHLNRHMKNAIALIREHMKVSFITYSAYDQEEDIYGAAI